MELERLLEGIEIKKVVGGIRREVKGIAYHSRQVKRGFLFAALKGLKADGHRFLEDAVNRGAEVLLLEEERTFPHATQVIVKDTRIALARVSGNFYGLPSAKVKLIGVTGTNGKTTITYLLEAILKRARQPVGVIGTINYRYGETVLPAPNTTPESLELQRILKEMVDQGISHVIMEVSSHGLDLERVAGCQFDGAIFTNLTRDHLDYHPDFDHYFMSKRKLFSDLLAGSPKEGRFAVTNADDPRGEAIIEGLTVPVSRYGTDSRCPITADAVISTLQGLSCTIKTPKGPLSVRSKLIGTYNLYNLMAAAAAGLAMGLRPETVEEGLCSLQGVPGRLEKVENRKGIHVLVDYAHTPDALDRSLKSLTSILKESRGRGGEGRERIITVFGCGGDRDRTKRPLMGEAAARWSDLIILTSDNPRTEDPVAIVEEAEAGIPRERFKRWETDVPETWRETRGYLKRVDRREAIRKAVRLAQPSDLILIAGKGHEDYQIIGTTKHPFDDRIEAQKGLEAM